MKTKNIRVLWLVLLLGVFVIPHTSNLLHFVIIEHDFNKRSNAVEYLNSNTVHYCEQYLFKYAPLLDFDVFNIDFWVDQMYLPIYVIDVRLEYLDFFYSYYLRGPPF
ncbi:hypothetical protein [Myroides pelagicus]|uniref:Uncharacterized protein n=1 Tax=Myroides pelagicus TaxID=270914 RepID=A0A7K1GKD2_9FLAO|nr:hypothetical protein [Myroides pelagicus]MEC4113018.1 hypothetical protein [Myroides pelagicus]MTH28979.1 hypothetical protein [Myroides pelagicus]